MGSGKKEKAITYIVPGEGICQQLWSECSLALFTQDDVTSTRAAQWLVIVCFSIGHAREGYIHTCVFGATKDSPNRRYTLNLHMNIHMQHFVMCLLLHTTLDCVNGVTGGGEGGHVSECACVSRLIICCLPLLFSIYLYNYSLVDCTSMGCI